MSLSIDEIGIVPNEPLSSSGGMEGLFGQWTRIGLGLGPVAQFRGDQGDRQLGELRRVSS